MVFIIFSIIYLSLIISLAFNLVLFRAITKKLKKQRNLKPPFPDYIPSNVYNPIIPSNFTTKKDGL
jgi:hypothetical protein